VTSPVHDVDARRAVLLLGGATVVAQALLIREAMAAMGGSEMAWGAVMALWLGGMGAGARLGLSLDAWRLVRTLPFVVLVLTGVSVLTLRAAPALLGAASGELLTTVSAFWLWAAAVLPPAVAGGLAFPHLAGRVGGGGRAYAFESSGALVGGMLLSAALMVVGSVASLAVALGIVGSAIMWPRRRWLAVAALAAATAAAVPVADVVSRLGWRWADHPGELRGWAETRLQRLEVSGHEPVTIYGDGRLLASYPDPYGSRPRGHLLMLLHPRPQRALVVGGAADGSIESMVRHPVSELALVEEDPELLRLIPRWYGPQMEAALADPRVRLIAVDPIRALRSSGHWDLILLVDGNPVSLRRNRTRTLEFLQICREHLAPGGVVVLRIAVADTYLGGGAGRLLQTLVATVDEVFPKRSLIPGDEVLVVAGGPEAEIALDPALLAARLHQRGIRADEMVPEMIPLLVDRDRRLDLEGRLDAHVPANTIQHPRAVLLAGGLHEARGKPGVLRLVLGIERTGRWWLTLALVVAAILVLATGLRRRTAAPSTAAVVGFGSMSWWMLLMASWQVSRGSVFSEIGALTALFMGGLAGGAGWAARWSRPERRLAPLLAGMVTVSIVVSSTVAYRLPLVVVPVLLLVGGLLTGAAFPGLSELAHPRAQRGAGLAFAADEVGAAAAALMVGIVAIPAAGLSATAAGVAALQAVAIPTVVSALRRE
jgi:spermidine synthase